MKSLLVLSAVFIGPSEEGLRLNKVEDGRLEVRAILNKEQRSLFPKGKVDPDLGEAWLRLGLVDEKMDRAGPPMLGRYTRVDDELLFRSSLPLDPGKRYRASFGPERAPLLTRDYRPPELKPGEAPRVVKIYPTGDVLPANHLKFYIFFSRPMRGGPEIFQQIEIQDADGNVITDAWLLDELWDETGQVLILYIHPGRIKWGVLLREILGPVLVPRRDYRLVIRRALEDAAGQKLAEEVVKKFRTGEEDRVRIELSEWKLRVPAAGTRDALRIDLGKALDHKGLERFVTVYKGKEKVAGKVEVAGNERAWLFRPERGWETGDYFLEVDERLEDVAGNTPRRPFDLDLSAPAKAAQELRIGFGVK